MKVGRKSKHWLITSLSLPSCHFPSTNDYQSYEIQPVFICKDRTLTKCCFNLSSHIHKDRIDISRVFSRCFEELDSPLVSDFLPNTDIVIMKNETGAKNTWWPVGSPHPNIRWCIIIIINYHQLVIYYNDSSDYQQITQSVTFTVGSYKTIDISSCNLRQKIYSSKYCSDWK